VGSRNWTVLPSEVSSSGVAVRPAPRCTSPWHEAASNPDQAKCRSVAGFCPVTVIPLVVKRRLKPSVVSIPRAGSPASATPPSNIPSGGRSIAPTVIYCSFVHGGTTSGPSFSPRHHSADRHRW
jgi:hypothetical protein